MLLHLQPLRMINALTDLKAVSASLSTSERLQSSILKVPVTNLRCRQTRRSYSSARLSASRTMFSPA